MKPDWMPYTIKEAAEIFGIRRTTLSQRLAPLMESGGYACRRGSSWWFHPGWVPQWGAFMNARRQLIEAGVWKEKRPHSVYDFEDWCNGDLDELLGEVGRRIRPLNSD